MIKKIVSGEKQSKEERQLEKRNQVWLKAIRQKQQIKLWRGLIA